MSVMGDCPTVDSDHEIFNDLSTLMFSSRQRDPFRKWGVGVRWGLAGGGFEWGYGQTQMYKAHTYPVCE